MKKGITLIVVLLLLFAMTACDASDQSQATESGIMEEIRDENGDLTGYERRYYNDNGGVTRWDVYDENENYLYYELYEYDENDRLYTQARYSSEGFAQYRYVYTYDDDGNLSEKAYEDPHGSATVTRYDAKGNETERLYYGTDEQLSKREVLDKGKWVTYDADGNIIK